jgi:uncharacterized membrane protein
LGLVAGFWGAALITCVGAGFHLTPLSLAWIPLVAGFVASLLESLVRQLLPQKLSGHWGNLFNTLAGAALAASLTLLR